MALYIRSSNVKADNSCFARSLRWSGGVSLLRYCFNNTVVFLPMRATMEEDRDLVFCMSALSVVGLLFLLVVGVAAVYTVGKTE